MLARMILPIILLASLLVVGTAALAEPQRPLPVPQISGACPSGYSSSPTSGFCVAGPSTKCRAVPKTSGACPPGWTASMGVYCIETGCSC